MPGEGIFLQVGAELAVLDERADDSEALLQEALARFPEVMAGSTSTGSATTRLLLVRREMGVLSAQGASATWSVDHLFVDADGSRAGRGQTVQRQPGPA